MFSPRSTPSSGRRQSLRVTGRKSLAGTPTGLLFSPRRTSLAARSTPTRVQSYSTSDALHFDVQTFGSSLPVKVMEALTMADGGSLTLSCHYLSASYTYCRMHCTGHPDQCSLADVLSHGFCSISVMAVAPEGTARFWPSLAHEGNYTETVVDMGENLCNFVVAVRGGSFIVSSYKGQMMRLGADPSGKLLQRALQQGQGVLSGIGRRVSSLFGMRAPLTNNNLHSVLWVGEMGCLYTLTSCGLSKWEVDEVTEHQVLSWDSSRALTESVADAIWGSESNYEEIKEGVNVTYMDMQLSQDGLVVLAAAWHPSDSPCLAYFCLVTLLDNGNNISDELSVEVTKYNPPFQSEDALQAMRLMLPRASSPAAFLYNEELVFACSTGTGRGGLPEEKIPFNTPGDRLRGGGCCANLPVFFSQNSGLVAVVARESASMLPETMEDSLCFSLAGAGPEVESRTPTRMEPVAQEDKTKLLKAAFLQFCRNDLVGAQTMTDELFPPEGDGDGEVGGELDLVVTRINLDLVDDYPASDPRWAESVPDESAGFPLTSLIILHQLEDKMKAHGCFMDFLLQVGLLDRLGQTAVRSSPMATRLLLCEHAEKLQAAMTLKNHHTKHGELVNRAILIALRKSNAAVSTSLTAADVFFREVSQISSVFECLLEEEERTLKENPVDSVKWAEVVLSVNTIIKVHNTGSQIEVCINFCKCQQTKKRSHLHKYSDPLLSTLLKHHWQRLQP
uniref:Uncharacterized protein n=1 Tax=Oncorhynchus tshawytscha TaxID=74940 RepID=A0A8C8IY81_ONCTS